MDIPSLASIIQAMLLSRDPEERKAYEERLNQLQDMPQHLVRLLEITVDENYDSSVRLIAIIQFKKILSNYWKSEDSDMNEIRPILLQSLDDTCKLENEVENEVENEEDPVLTLMNIVAEFGADIAPYAVRLCENLAAAAYSKYLNMGAVGAVRLLRAINSILESVTNHAHLLSEIEPTLLPIMQKILKTGGDGFKEVLEIASCMTAYSPKISLDLWSLWPLMVNALVNGGIGFFPNILVPLDNFISRGTTRFLTCKNPDYQQNLYKVLSTLMTDKNIDDGDIEPAPKLIDVVFHICKGQVDHWVEPYLLLILERFDRAETSNLKPLLIQVVANMLYYNPGLTFGVLHKTGLTSKVFDSWFKMLQQKEKSGMPANFKREYDKKVCCLGLTSLLALSDGQFSDEELKPVFKAKLDLVFKATLDLLVAYKDQLAAEAMSFSYNDNNDIIPQNNSDYDSTSDEEEEYMYQSPIDEIDAFVYFSDVLKDHQDDQRFQNLNRSLDINYQAILNGITEYAEERRVEIEKEKQKKAEEDGSTHVPAPAP